VPSLVQQIGKSQTVPEVAIKHELPLEASGSELILKKKRLLKTQAIVRVELEHALDGREGDQVVFCKV
jgi:hypothetical protein